MPENPTSSIDGITFFRSSQHVDARGSIGAFPLDDIAGAAARQINVVTSRKGSLRGIHVHALYDEYYLPVSGLLHFGLIDIRRRSPTYGKKSEIEIQASTGIGFCVPAGVAHAVLFRQAGILVYGLSRAWSPAGEYGCRWDDPNVGFNWPPGLQPVLSDRDASAPTFLHMTTQFDSIGRAT